MKNLIILISILIVVSSCSRKYFTPDLRSKLIENKIPLNKIQFYSNKKIKIYREINESDINIKNGIIKHEDGKILNVIILKRRIPGICIADSTNILNICFDSDDSKYFEFYSDWSDIDSKTKAFQIFFDDSNNSLKYGKDTFKIYDKYKNAKLQIRKSDINVLEINKEKLKGRKVQ